MGVLAATWLRQEPRRGAHPLLDPAHVGVLDQEHDLPVVRGWNLGAGD